jgi:outer membrane lipoprotein carrier protein
VFKQARTVRATFEQTLKNPLTGTEARATGELLLEQPNRMAVTFTNPSGDRVVSDGKWLWVYLPSSAPNQVIKLPAKSKGISGVDMVGELLTAPTSRYDVADAGAATLAGRSTRAVTLTPKADGGAIAKATVWIDDADASLRQFEVTDANGLVRTVRMISWTANASVPSGAFRFTVPSGVRVLDQSMLTGQF